MNSISKIVICYLLLFSINQSFGEDSNNIWMKGGLSKNVFHVSISSNNKYLLSVSTSNTKVWSIENGNLIKILPSRLGYPYAPFVFSNDGKYLYYGDSASIKLYNIEKDKVVKKYFNHKKYVCGLSLSFDGKMLLSCAKDSNCVIQSLEKSSITKTFKMPEQIFRVQLIKGNKTFLADGSKTSYIVDIISGKIKREIKTGNFTQSSIDNLMAFDTGHISGSVLTEEISIYDTSGRVVNSFSFHDKRLNTRGFSLSKDGQYLLICQNKELKIYDPEEGKLLYTIKGVFDTPAIFSPDGKWISANIEYSNDSLRNAGIFYRDAVGIYDFETGALSSILQAKQYSFRPPAFSNDSHLLATTDLKLWDIYKGRLVRSFGNHTSAVLKIVTNTKNKIAASLSESGEVFIWDSETGNTINKILMKRVSIHNIEFSIDGKNLLVYSYYESPDTTYSKFMNSIPDSLSVSIWDIKSCKLNKEIKLKTKRYFIEAMSKEGDNIFLYNNGEIGTFNLSSNQYNYLSNNLNNYESVSFSPQRNYIVFDDSPIGKIDIYSLNEEKLLFSLMAHKGFVRTISWSFDEKLFVSTGQDDNKLKVWDINDGSLIKTFNLDKPQVHYGSLSPDGNYFAGSSKDGFIYIWELTNGKIIRSLHASWDYIWCIKWSTNGRFIYQGNSDGTIIAWETNLF